MRLSTQQYFLQGSNAITDLNSQVARVQEQISSGRRVLTASDDPASAARILRLESQVNITEQYQTNIDFGESRLLSTEQALTAIESSINRVRELVIQAGNGALSNEERSAISVEISQRTDELFDLTNTQNEQGDFIFSGFNTDNPAYARSGGGQFQYEGDGGIKRLQISEASFLSISENGADVFEGIEIHNSQIVTSAVPTNSNNFQLIASVVDDRAVFDAVYPEDYVVSFNAEAAVIPAGPNYSVTRVSDGSPVVNNVPYVEVNGISFEGLLLSGVGAPQSGDQFNIESVSSQNMLTTVEGIAAEVDTFADSQERSDFVASSLQNLDAIQSRLLEARTRVGVSLNRIETARNTLADRQLAQQSLLSEVRDLDYAAAISNLTFTSFVLEASQASFSRISNLSLFNYLR